ncbi:hypothetical protein K3495_g9706 [Podosphaera aphanis]|nr:hypothetical protein K3495_g9706 [Podosphaera aphanis]
MSETYAAQPELPPIHASRRSMPLASFPLSSPPPTPSSEVWPRETHRFIMSSPTRAPSPQFNRTSFRDSRQAGAQNIWGCRFSARQKRLNPSLLQRNTGSRNEERETRRNLFLKRVREASEEKRWRERKVRTGETDDEVLRALWIAERNRWKEQRRQEALNLEFPGELEDIPEEMSEAENELHELDQIILEEERSYLNLEDAWVETVAGQTEIPSIGASYENEDEEYDHIFMQFIEEEKAKQSSLGLEPRYGEDQEMMDTS